MSTQIDDLYVLLRAQTGPLLDGFLEAGTAGEELAAQTAAAMTEITASVDRMAENYRIASGSVAESARMQRYEVERLALATQEASWKMEAATAKAAAANKALAESMAAPTLMTSLKAATPVIGGITLAVGIAAAAAVHMGANFESSTQKIVSSGGEIQENIDKVRAGLLDMAGEVGVSSMKLSDAFYKASGAGFNYAHGGLDVVRAASEGAKTEQADLTTVTDALSSAMVDYKFKSSDAATVMSKMVAATAAGKMTFQEMAGAMSSILPVASAAHITLDDVLSSLAAMTVHGMSAQQAAQNMADAIRHLQTAAQNGVMSKELAALGISAQDLQAKLGERGLSGTLNLVADRIASKLGPDQKQIILNLNDAIKLLPNNVHDLASKVLDGSVSMKEFIKSAKDMNVINDKQVVSFATLAGGLHQIGSESKSGAEVYQSYAGAMNRAMGDASGMNVALMLTGSNLDQVQRSTKMVSGATAEAGNHVKGWHEIQGTFNQKMSEAKSTFGALATEIGTKLLPAVGAIVGGITSVVKWFEKHKTATVALASIIGGVLVVGLYMATMAVYAFTVALLTNPITWIVLAIAALIFIIVELVMHWKTVTKFIKEAAEAVWHWLVDVWKAIAKDTEKFWKNDIVKPIMAAWHAIESFFKSAWHAVADPIVKAWHWVEDTTKTVWNAITSWFKKWWPLLLLIFLPPIAVLMAIWNHFHTQIMSVVHTVWNAVSGFFKAAWKDIQENAKAGWNLFHKFVIDPVEAAWHKIEEIWHRVERVLSDVWDRVKTAAASAWNAIYQRIIAPVENAWHRVEAVASNLWHALTNAINGAWNEVSGIASRFWKIGENIVDGIVHGVSNAGARLFKSLRNLANDALNAAKSFLGINSPSKLFSDHVGVSIPEGIAEGVIRAAAVARDAVQGLVGGLAVEPKFTATAGLQFSMDGAPSIPGVSLPAGVSSGALPSSSSSGAQTIIINQPPAQVLLDGEELRNAQIRTAQRTKLRNGSTYMT